MTIKVLVIAALFIGVAVPAAGATAFWAFFNLDLPGTIPEERNIRPESRPTLVYDADGNKIAEFREFELTVPTEPEDIPNSVERAVIAIEDRRFYEHKGVDPEGLVRAAITNYQNGDVVQGGSTITQQYVKNTYTTGERTISRKLREAILASRLERELTKDEILFRYLDTIYFGDGAYGIGAAAESYFHKPVAELSISEAALLAGAISAPAEYGPRVNIEVAEQRRRTVLEAMRDTESITDDQYRRALAQGIWYAPFGEPPGPATVVHPPPGEQDPVYPYFVDYVRRHLIDQYGEDEVYRGGLRVETALDPRLQIAAARSVAETLDGTAPPLEMSLVSVEPDTGFVRAMIGGRDFAASQVNLALGGDLGMQPGSSFKPYVLATAFTMGLGPESEIDAPGSVSFASCPDGCVVNNADFANRGVIDLREATVKSVNTAYALLIDRLGTRPVAELAAALGVSAIGPEQDYGISLALGAYEVSPLDMAAGFSVFANRGVRQEATPVIRIFDDEDRVVEDNTNRPGRDVLPEAVADTVTDVLTGVVAGGTGKAADIGRPVAGKTGTAEDFRAAWFVGYTPQLSTSVWMGYSDSPRPLLGIKGVGSVSGGTLPAATWADYMRAALEGQPALAFAEPGPLPVPGPIVDAGRDGEPDALPSAPAPLAPVAAGDPRYPTGLVADCDGPCVIDPETLAP
jgi:penicillin-binding protein 1A